MKLKNGMLKVIISCAMACSMAISSGTVFASELKPSETNLMVEDVYVASNPTGVYAGSGSASIRGSGMIYVSIPSGCTAKRLYFIGNKDGGGANTTANISGLSGVVNNVPVNGTWSLISSANMVSYGPNTIQVYVELADKSTTYNIAITARG